MHCMYCMYRILRTGVHAYTYTVHTYGKYPYYRTPHNTDPYRFSVTMRDIKKVYKHELLVI